MPITPAIVAPQLIALSVAGAVLLAGGFAWRILRRWDIRSGGELQLRLERQTYLISTPIVKAVFWMPVLQWIECDENR